MRDGKVGDNNNRWKGRRRNVDLILDNCNGDAVQDEKKVIISGFKFTGQVSRSFTIIIGASSVLSEGSDGGDGGAILLDFMRNS